jgi:hypothetical protein
MTPNSTQAQVQIPAAPVQLPPQPEPISFLDPIGWAVLLKVILDRLFQNKK